MGWAVVTWLLGVGEAWVGGGGETVWWEVRWVEWMDGWDGCVPAGVVVFVC